MCCVLTGCLNKLPDPPSFGIQHDWLMEYDVIDLGSLGDGHEYPTAINNKSQVVGYTTLADAPNLQLGNGEAPSRRANTLRVRLLSTMLATRGIGEWGFAALVEVDGRRILFDTGQYPDTVLRNARELGIDLSDVTDVVLSHFHRDHTGGLLALRAELSQQSPAAISRVHVGKGMFASRGGPDDGEGNGMIETRAAFQSSGGVFVIHDGPSELYPGVWVTGPVSRPNDERNWSGSRRIKTEKGWEEDTIPESQSLVIDTEQGLVVISGCGHAGIINTLEYARERIRAAPIHAALGGFHLLAADDKHLAWTSQKLRAMGIEHFLGAHCTGIEAVYRIRDEAGLSRRNCVVGAVGASFTLGEGIDPLWLAR